MKNENEKSIDVMRDECLLMILKSKEKSKLMMERFIWLNELCSEMGMGFYNVGKVGWVDKDGVLRWGFKM